jgi:hypothetical protein
MFILVMSQHHQFNWVVNENLNEETNTVKEGREFNSPQEKWQIYPSQITTSQVIYSPYTEVIDTNQQTSSHQTTLLDIFELNSQPIHNETPSFEERNFSFDNMKRNVAGFATTQASLLHSENYRGIDQLGMQNAWFKPSLHGNQNVMSEVQPPQIVFKPRRSRKINVADFETRQVPLSGSEYFEIMGHVKTQSLPFEPSLTLNQDAISQVEPPQIVSKARRFGKINVADFEERHVPLSESKHFETMGQLKTQTIPFEPSLTINQDAMSEVEAPQLFPKRIQTWESFFR